MFFRAVLVALVACIMKAPVIFMFTIVGCLVVSYCSWAICRPLLSNNLKSQSKFDVTANVPTGSLSALEQAEKITTKKIYNIVLKVVVNDYLMRKLQVC